MAVKKLKVQVSHLLHTKSYLLSFPGGIAVSSVNEVTPSSYKPETLLYFKLPPFFFLPPHSHLSNISSASFCPHSFASLQKVEYYDSK